MAPPLLLLSEIVLRFGGEPLLDGAELSVLPGERLCLVGRNGSGKSTLLRIAAGLIDTDSGERFLKPGTTVRYLPQEPDLFGFSTTRAYAEDGLAPGDDLHRAQHLLERLGLTGNENPATLSGGEKRRTALARVLAPLPDILLLDEPTNHLDLPTIEWLETELKSSRLALVLISHDRRFLKSLSRNVIWLERGASMMGSAPSRFGATKFLRPKRSSVTSSTARLRGKTIGYTVESPLDASETWEGSVRCKTCVSNGATKTSPMVPSR